MIRLFASDLDGTLLNAEHVCDEEIAAGIEKIFAHEKYIAAATGRSLCMLAPANLPPVYKVVMNGAAIFDREDTLLYQHPIDPALIEELTARFPSLPLEYNTLDGIYTMASEEEVLHSFIRKEESRHQRGMPEGALSTFNQLKQRHTAQSRQKILSLEVLKINCVNDFSEECHQLQAFLDERKDQLISAPSYEWLFEITAAGVSKAASVKKLGEILGIAEDETAVYGDGGNDLEMLQTFASSYAPVDACEEARQAAGSVIGPYTEHSVIRHMLERIEAENE